VAAAATAATGAVASVVVAVAVVAGVAVGWIKAATGVATALGSTASAVPLPSSLAALSWFDLSVELLSVDFAVLLPSDLEEDLLSLDEVLSVWPPDLSEVAVADELLSFDALDWSAGLLLRELELLLPEAFALLARGAGGALLDGSAGAAASTMAEKLSVVCDGSGRVDFGAL
jgi:hypothetical protein